MSNDPSEWTPWIAAPRSGFRVDDERGEVGLIQIDDARFVVTTAFRYVDEPVEQRLREQLIRDGADPGTVDGVVAGALTFPPTQSHRSDLASVPPFMRWFENSYGPHTLAAIIHDDLIVDRPNGGALGSDVASDFVFREMMRSAGVGWLKRWVMWAAVALRSRWVAGGFRQLSVALWGLLALAGITTFAVAAVNIVRGDGGWPWLLAALALGVVAAPLWGRQIGAGLISMISGFFLVPAAVMAALGLLTFRILDAVLRRIGLT